MYIKIGSFSKRHNSTKQPAANWGTRLNVDLKEDCSMEEPVFKLGFSAWNPAYNYIYAEEWNRYYFVINVTVNIGRIWEVQCKLDTAGTYKADIQNMNAFVLYASGSNTEIVDERLSIKTTPDFSVTNGGTFPGIVQQGGRFVLTIVGKESTSSYACTYQEMLDLLNSVASWANIEMPLPTLQLDQTAMMKEAGETIVKALRQIIATGHAGDNIKACTYVPFGSAAFTGKTQTKQVYLGEYNTGMYLQAITDRHYGVGMQMAIPWQATDWRRNAPYHELYLVIPSLGVISLSPSDLIGCTNIIAFLSADLITGEAKIIVEADARNRQIGIYGVNYGAQYPVGASNVTPMDITTSLLGGVSTGIAAVASGGAAAAVIGANWATGTMNNLQPTPTCVGGNGGAASLGADQTMYLYSIFHDTTVTPGSVSAVMGVPQHQTMTLSGLSGYVQTQNASVQGDSMSDAARQEINAMCDGGIYIE